MCSVCVCVLCVCVFCVCVCAVCVCVFCVCVCALFLGCGLCVGCGLWADPEMTEPDYTSLLPPGTSVHVLATPAQDPTHALERVASELGAPPELPPSLIATLAPPVMPRGEGVALSAATIGAAVAACLPHDAIVVDEGLTSSGGFWAASDGAQAHDVRARAR
eukprot:COSAG05_NODE_3228_length_2223_cov_3.104520_4_plen_161_part_01